MGTVPSDSLDAESAARSVLNGQARTLAKTWAGTSEMIRHIKLARDGAVKARSQASAALYRVAIVRMRDHDETKAYTARRTAEGKTRREIAGCVKRYLVREIYRRFCAPRTPPREP